MPLQNQNQTTAKERALARAKANALAEQRAAEQRQVGAKMSLPAAASGGEKRTGLAADSSWSQERKTAAQKANREAVKSLTNVAKKDAQSRFGGLKNDAETQRQIALANKMGTGGSWEDTRASRAIKSGLSGTAAGLTNAVGTVMGSLESDKNYGLAVDSGKIPKKATGEEWNNRLGRKLRPAVESVQGLADKMQARSEKEYEEGTKGLNTAQRMLFDAGVAGTQMLGDMAIGALTGGNTLAPMAARVFGQGAQEARQAGATRDQQLLYGALSAGVETFTEKMFDGLNLVYGKGAADRIVESVAKKLASGETGQSVVKALIGSAGEGLEEVVSGLLSPALEAIYNGKSAGENYSELEAAELLYEGAVGALLGGVGGAANVAETARNMRGQRRTEEPKNLKTAEGQQNAQEEPKHLKRAEEQSAQKPAQEEPRYLKTAEEMAAEPTLEELMAGGRATQEQQEAFIRKYGEDAFNRLVIENMQNGRIDGEGNDLVWKAEEPRHLQTAEEPARQTAQELQTEEPRYLQTAEGQTAQEMQEPRYLKTAEDMALEEPGVHGDTAWMSRGDADYLSRLAKAARASIEVVDTLGDAQGTYDPKTGRIRIAKDATDPVGFVTQHELTHRIRDNAPQQWGQFLEHVQKHYGEDWNSVLEGYQRRYAEHDIELTAEEAAEEAAADFAGRMNESDIRRLTQENRSLAQRILDTIRDLIRKLKGGENQKLYEMERLWASALKEGKKNTANEGGKETQAAKDGGKNAEKTKKSLKSYTEEEKRQHVKDAAAYFGRTYKWAETGYITTDGKRLDFSGRHEGGSGGYRTVDHRDIRDALGDDYGGDDYSGSMAQFMSEGNIRVSPESGGIDLSVKPTKAQEAALSDFISKQHGEVILDLGTPDGQTVSGTEYPRGTHASKVLADIRAYFEDGTTPQVSEVARYRQSLKGSKEAAEEIEREAGRKRRLQAAEGGEIKPGEEARKAFNEVRKARRAAERAERVNRLTDAEKETVDKLLKGELPESSDEVNQHVLAAYRAKKVYEDYAGEIREYRKEHRGALREKADQALGDLTAWKDKKAGLLYSRETMERNIRDIAPDKEAAKRIVEKYFTPVHEGEAKATRMKNEYRDRVRKLSLSRKVAKGNKVSEAAAVQILGEAESAIQSLENAKEGARRDGKTLKEWRGIVEDLWRENPALDQGKIGGAVEEFRGLYDELIQQINEVRVRNGYEPVEYRKGYFPHFKNGEADGALKALGRALGIETEVTQLPTSINGLTHTFKPGIRWFGNALERTGYDTVYDAVEGFDRYIEGAAGVVTQTDNIQNLRALANQIRWRSTDEGIRAEMERIQGNDALDEGQKQELLQRLFDNGRYALSNFVAELDEYTNLLANKKSRGDRSMEAKLGRNAYTLMKNLEGRVAANMVAVNPASWLTNFVPLTQGFATVDAGNMFRGMWDTMRAYKEDDGFAGKSSFLTNRRGSDPLVKTWAQNASAKLSKPMEYIDTFAADSLVRARYLQNKEGGLSDAEAMREADAWAAGVMADRSKGATPTIFSEKNPITKLFTQFQLEVNNQLSWLLKDLPDDKKEKGAAAIAAALLKFFVGSFLYNELYEYVIGRRPALDPLGMLNDAVGDLAGRELPNLTDAAVKTARGEEFKLKQSEPQGIYGAATGLAESVAENLPFVGGILGGGRIPISSALPDFENLAKAIAYDGWSDEKRAATLAKELSAPATYLALPFGGGQLKKIYQSIKAVKEGGSYSMDKDGNPLLQYPVYNDTEKQRAGALTKSMIFGKSSLKPAQDWVESGFDSFNAKETATYQGMNDAGVSDEDAYALIREMGNAKKTKTMSATTWKRRILQNADISEAGKSVAYYGLLANDKEQELMDELEGSENMGAVTEVLMELKDADLLSGKQANNKRMTALMDNRLSNRGKLKIYQEMISDDTEDLEDALSVGVSFDDFLQFKETVYGLASDETETKKEKVMDAIDNMDLTKEQKDELYFAAGYKEKTLWKDAPWRNGTSRTRYLPGP